MVPLEMLYTEAGHGYINAEVARHIDEVQIFELNQDLQKAITQENKAEVQRVAEQIAKKGDLMGPRAAKKTMLAKQVLQELNADLGRYEIDLEATARERERIRSERPGWLSADAEQVADRFRGGELKVHDLVRQYGVILDWGTGQLLPKTTEQFRAMLRRRAASHWLQA